jgi:O-antigen ligase
MRWPTGMEAIREALVLFLFAYVSLVPFYAPDASTAVKYLPFALAMAAICLGLWNTLRQQIHVDTTLLMLVGCHLVAGAASLLNARYADIGAAKLIYFSVTGPLLLFAVGSFGMEAVARTARGLAAVGVTATLYGLGVWISSSGGHLLGILGHHSVNGTYIAALLPIIWISVRISFRGSDYRWLSWGSIFTLLPALFLTFSRGAWLASMAGGATLLRHRPRAFGVDRVRIAGVVSLLILAWALLDRSDLAILRHSGVTDALRRTWTKTMRFEQADAHRLQQWHTTGRVLDEYPAMGLGFGNFTRRFDEYSEKVGKGVTAKTTDNMFLMVACEMGLIGLSVFLGLIGYLGRVLWRTAATDTGLATAIFASFTTLTVAMLFWDVLNHPTIRILFWTLAGLGVALWRGGDHHER